MRCVFQGPSPSTRPAAEGSERGFTLLETLVAVAIAAVLLGLGAVDLLAARRELHLTALDESARDIYMAAQSALTGLKVRGLIGGLGGAAADAEGEILYFESGGPEAEALLPPGSILEDGHYIVEYMPGPGTVYAVLYAEDRETLDAWGLECPTGRRERLGAGIEVGFYGGKEVHWPEVSPMPRPGIEVENGEELKVTVFGDFSSVEPSGGVRVKLTFEGAESGGTRELDVTRELSGGMELEYTAVLDSLREGENFYSIFGPEFTPGEDVTVRVTAYTEDGSRLPTSTAATVNSLFAYKDEDGTAYIACGRHLQNLSAQVSHIGGIPGARQICPIDFAAGGGGERPGWAEVYPEGSGYMALRPIEIESGDFTYDGGGLGIRNMREEPGAAGDSSGQSSPGAGWSLKISTSSTPPYWGRTSPAG